MTHEERNNLMGILTGILIISYIGWSVYTKAEAGVFAGPDALMIWARTVLWAIPIGIISMIISMILFNIIYAIATNNANPSFVVDERDQSIKIWGMRVTAAAMSTGFIITLIGLAFGWSAFTACNMIFFSFAFGDLLGNLTKLVLYRRGL